MHIYIYIYIYTENMVRIGKKLSETGFLEKKLVSGQNLPFLTRFHTFIYINIYIYIYIYIIYIYIHIYRKFGQNWQKPVRNWFF